MKKQLHPNYFKASRLIFLSGGIYILNSVISNDVMSFQSDIGLGFLIIGVVTFGLGWLVRQGHGWVKYMILAGTIAGLFLLQTIAENIKLHPVAGVVDVIVSLIQIWAMVLLFMIPKRLSMVAENR